jgi:hypothetical protein
MTSAATPQGRSDPSRVNDEDEDADQVAYPGDTDLQPVTGRGTPASHQLQIDIELFAALREVNFTGPGWDHFATETARYAVDVITSMLCKRTFTAELARKHVLFRPTVEETDRLATDRRHRDSVVDFAVRVALEKFRQKGRAGKGWRPHGGALIRTWFTTASMYEVINQRGRKRFGPS